MINIYRFKERGQQQNYVFYFRYSTEEAHSQDVKDNYWLIVFFNEINLSELVRNIIASRPNNCADDCFMIKLVMIIENREFL